MTDHLSQPIKLSAIELRSIGSGDEDTSGTNEAYADEISWRNEFVKVGNELIFVKPLTCLADSLAHTATVVRCESFLEQDSREILSRV